MGNKKMYFSYFSFLNSKVYLQGETAGPIDLGIDMLAEGNHSKNKLRVPQLGLKYN
jgi:hypothetical protein